MGRTPFHCFVARQPTGENGFYVDAAARDVVDPGSLTRG